MSWRTRDNDSELPSYDYFFLDCVCRICWSANGVKEITVNSENEENAVNITEKMFDCLGIDVTMNTHPKKICESCLYELEYFCEFKKFCHENERKLLDILSKGPVIADNNELIIKNEENIEAQLAECDYENYSNSENETGTKQKKKTKKAPTYCTSCRFDLQNMESLSQHNLDFHGIIDGLFKCFGCEKHFKFRKRRLRHEKESCKALKCGYKCDNCQRFLPRRSMWEKHLKAHRNNEVIKLPEDLFKCNTCKRMFKSMELLTEHRTVHERDKKNFVCDACGRVFTRRDYLNKHKLRHDGIKQHSCPHCDFTTIQRSSLTVHLRKHTGERPYACDLCQHRCVTSSNLKEHRKRHLGIKDFECQLCDKKFGYKISLEEHMSSIHERSETYTCDQCNATYSRFRGLRRHLLTKHNKHVTKGSVEEKDCDDNVANSVINLNVQ